MQSCAGWFDYVKPVQNAEATFLYEITSEQCKFIHDTKIFKYDNTHIITNLNVNQTRTTPIVFAGSAEGNNCQGQFYSDAYGTFYHAFVQGHIKITLTQQTASVDLNNNKIILNSGISCEFNKYHCIDIQNGHTFWQNFVSHGCISDHYSVLYYGFCEKIIDFSDLKNNITTYVLNSQQISFAFKITHEITVCDIVAYQTIHPKILILDSNKAPINQIFERISLNTGVVENLDLFTYINQISFTPNIM